MPELIDIRYELPEIKRALVLAPHPDDETLGCGGTISLYAGRIAFTVVTLSNGEAVDIPEDNKGKLRKKEHLDALEILGVKDVVLLELPDGRFRENRDLIKKKFSEIFLMKNPELVFSPSPYEAHPDHRETAMACIDSVKTFPSVKIAFYEIYNPVRFNTLIDISQRLDTKRDALKKYHYSMLKKEDMFAASSIALNRFRSLFTLLDSYYEAFWIPDAVPGPSEISSWCTYDALPAMPEEKLLDTIRIADSLISQVRQIENEAEKKDSVIRDLKAEVAGQKETIAKLDEQVRMIEKSLFWKLAGRLHKARDVALPQGTGIRNLYKKIISSLKNRSG
jgi:N-acetylglucosamine malate deacetylase 1